MSVNSEAVVLMLIFGSAWGFVRLLTDVIVGSASLSVWVHRKIRDRPDA